MRRISGKKIRVFLAVAAVVLHRDFKSKEGTLSLPLLIKLLEFCKGRFVIDIAPKLRGILKIVLEIGVVKTKPRINLVSAPARCTVGMKGAGHIAESPEVAGQGRLLLLDILLIGTPSCQEGSPWSCR